MDRLISHNTAIKMGLYPQPKQPEQPAMTAPALNENFLEHLFNNINYEEAPIAYTAAINALTGRVVWALASHFGQMARETEHLVPTLDSRNELDEKARGEEFARTYVRPAQGHDPSMTQYEIAQICDRLRVTLYEQLREQFAMEPAEDALVRQFVSSERPPFWPMPQSLEGYLLWQIRSRAALSPDQQSTIHFANSTYGEDQARLTEQDIKKRNATRAAQYKELARQTMTEVLGWGCAKDENLDAFCKLPSTVQVEIAEAIQSALFRRSISVLNGNKPFAELKSDSDLIRGLAAKAAAWLNQPLIKHFRGIIAYRNEQRGQKRPSNPLLEKAAVVVATEDAGDIESMADDPV